MALNSFQFFTCSATPLGQYCRRNRTRTAGRSSERHPSVTSCFLAGLHRYSAANIPIGPPNDSDGVIPNLHCKRFSIRHIDGQSVDDVPRRSPQSLTASASIPPPLVLLDAVSRFIEISRLLGSINLKSGLEEDRAPNIGSRHG